MKNESSHLGGNQGTLQKTCAKDIEDQGSDAGQDLGSPVSQSKIGMTIKSLKKRIALINKLIRGCYGPSTQPGAWGYKYKQHRVSVLKLLNI